MKRVKLKCLGNIETSLTKLESNDLQMKEYKGNVLQVMEMIICFELDRCITERVYPRKGENLLEYTIEEVHELMLVYGYSMEYKGKELNLKEFQSYLIGNEMGKQEKIHKNKENNEEISLDEQNIKGYDVCRNKNQTTNLKGEIRMKNRHEELITKYHDELANGVGKNVKFMTNLGNVYTIQQDGPIAMVIREDGKEGVLPLFVSPITREYITHLGARDLTLLAKQCRDSAPLLSEMTRDQEEEFLTKITEQVKEMFGMGEEDENTEIFKNESTVMKIKKGYYDKDNEMVKPIGIAIKYSDGTEEEFDSGMLIPNKGLDDSMEIHGVDLCNKDLYRMNRNLLAIVLNQAVAYDEKLIRYVLEPSLESLERILEKVIL